MRSTLFLAAPLLLIACGREAPTAPATDEIMRPAFAVQRETLTSQFTLREQNPCNLEPVTFEVTLTLTQIQAGPPGGAKLLRRGIVERFTGIGNFGTIYTGQEHINVVIHSSPDDSWGSSGRVMHVRGSLPGTSFVLVVQLIAERNTTDIRGVANHLRCLGPGSPT
jgi:hypothetical protein